MRGFSAIDVVAVAVNQAGCRIIMDASRGESKTCCFGPPHDPGEGHAGHFARRGSPGPPVRSNVRPAIGRLPDVDRFAYTYVGPQKPAPVVDRFVPWVTAPDSRPAISTT